MADSLESGPQQGNFYVSDVILAVPELQVLDSLTPNNEVARDPG